MNWNNPLMLHIRKVYLKENNLEKNIWKLWRQTLNKYSKKI